MEKKIDVFYRKALKLTNALIVSADVEDFDVFNQLVEKMEDYIKTKGACPVGPVIHKIEYCIDNQGQTTINTHFIRQASTFFNHVDSPYKMEAVIRIPNCMYARYVGPEEKSKLAYEKIDVVAFENDIELGNEVYTILVDQQGDEVITDVFHQRK